MIATHSHGYRISAAAVLVLGLTPSPAFGDQLVWASGRVVDAAGKPVAGAVVVAYDDKDKIVDSKKTDDKGGYEMGIAEDSDKLETKKGGGYVAGVAGKVRRFVNAQATGLANGVRTTMMAVTTTQAAGLTAPLARTALDTGTRTADRIQRHLTPKQENEEQKRELAEA